MNMRHLQLGVDGAYDINRLRCGRSESGWFEAVNSDDQSSAGNQESRQKREL
jgi:hypothetical protein